MTRKEFCHLYMIQLATAGSSIPIDVQLVDQAADKISKKYPFDDDQPSVEEQMAVVIDGDGYFG